MSINQMLDHVKQVYVYIEILVRKTHNFQKCKESTFYEEK